MLLLVASGTLIPFTVVICFLEWLHFPYPGSWGSYIICTYLCTGLAVTSTMPLAMPLHTKHHIPIQLLVVAIMVFVQVPRFCAVLESKPHVHEYMLWVWRMCSRGSWAILDSMYMMRTLEVTVPDAATACAHMHVCLHVIFGLVVPTYMLWVLEYQSRAFYLRENLDKGPNDDMRRWPPLSWASIAFHAVLLLPLFAICWEALLQWFINMDSRCFLVNGSVVGNCPSWEL